MQWFTPSRLSSAVVPGVALAALVAYCPAVRAESLVDWQFDPATQQLTLILPAGTVPQSTVTPTSDRLVITLANTQLGTVATTATYDGPIQRIQLLPRDNAVDIVLVLAPGVALEADPGQLVAVEAAGQTRWVYAPQLAPVAQASEAPPAMIVELPPLPADPNLNWPYTGVGRLSISAANLMRPANLDAFNTLPETLAIDPFNLGLPTVTEQVSVPSLEELDAAVGVAIANPAVTPAPTVAPAQPVAQVPAPTATPAPSPDAPPTASLPPLPTSAPSTVQPQILPPTPDPATLNPAAIDQDNGGQAIAVNPVPTAAITTPPPSAAPGPSPTPSPSLPSAPQNPPFLTVPPPSRPDAVASETVPPAPATTVLTVPTPPTAAAGVVIPPSVEPIPVAVGPDAALSFGQPLPGSLSPGAVPPGPDRRLAPDTLIAAGSILELRYTGPSSLALDPGTVHQEVLVLETEIRDPMTNGLVAPAGSQLIGQFRPSGDGHQWVSQMLIAPNGQRVPFASTSDYVYNSPQVSGGTLALGAGLGALALTLLTGFGGIGLLGGALIGATTAVGTAPQLLVIEPNQVIYAEVMQDVYRVMPIATMPAETQEWGALPGTWQVP
ncbi:AMIN domain-containing protein [Leptolyngbya sp. BL0902]|uniref:AMIN domain-containing protein n=1 Tax=Leptolyngbya sp. BL0902 TaxID=1115757 RepID=UPI0018E8E5D6|nr:AMIN domain-containing protein [Leptolyngbya sp. BL0902]